VELLLGRESRFNEIHVGPYRTLLDEKGILAGAEFPPCEPDHAEEMEALRRVLFWFWHELSHFTAAVGRGQLWWAYGQLEALRSLCVNLVRVEQRVEAQEEAYDKLDQVLSTAELSALRTTFAPMERRAMLRTVADIVGFYRERAPVVATVYGLTYPKELERLMCDSPRPGAGNPLGTSRRHQGARRRDAGHRGLVRARLAVRHADAPPTGL
jgi:hypothetical protein